MVKPLAQSLAKVYKSIVRCQNCGNLKIIGVGRRRGRCVAGVAQGPGEADLVAWAGGLGLDDEVRRDEIDTGDTGQFDAIALVSRAIAVGAYTNEVIAGGGCAVADRFGR